MAASQPGATASSASQKRSERPRAARMAVLSAKDLPFSAPASTTRIRTSGRAAARPRKISTEASVEPLSARMISQERSHSWITRLASVSASVSAPLKQAMITLISSIS